MIHGARNVTADGVDGFTLTGVAAGRARVDQHRGLVFQVTQHEGGVDRLRAGFVSFARDDHWQRAKPPAPFQAFMAKWRDHVPPEIPGLSVEGSP